MERFKCLQVQKGNVTFKMSVFGQTWQIIFPLKIKIVQNILCLMLVYVYFIAHNITIQGPSRWRCEGVTK